MAISESKAPKIFICNVATQRHETDGFGVEEHLGVFQALTGVAVTHIVVNNNVENLPKEWNQAAVPSVDRIDGFGGIVILADVVDEQFRTRHDTFKVAKIIGAIEL